MTLSVRQIRAFQEVAEAASFTGAAERLNLTQSAVSMLIRQLEEELGQARWIHYSDDFSNLLVRTILTQHQEFGQQDMRVRGMTTALALVATAEFMTVAPGYASLFEETFGVRFLDFEGPASRRTFLQYSRDGHELSPAAQAFLDIARSAGPKGARSRD